MKNKILGKGIQFGESRSAPSRCVLFNLGNMLWPYWHTSPCNLSAQCPTGAAGPSPPCPELSPANSTAQPGTGLQHAALPLFGLLLFLKFITNLQMRNVKSKKPQEEVVSRHGKGDHTWEWDLCVGKELQLPQSNRKVKMKGEVWT